MLRVLQEGEVERLGSARTIKVDVRVIAATNKDLEEEIAEGRFREDLYFRLSVIPIAVPPLRERLDDIPALVQHFVAQFSRENNRRPARFGPGALDALRQARWRGNIRELRNVVERLLIMSDGDVIEADDVRAVVRADARVPPAPAWLARARCRRRHAPRLDAQARHAPRVQGVVRARVPGRQAARARLEHLEDGRGHRHAAQQSLQEARAVHGIKQETDG